MFCSFSSKLQTGGTTVSIIACSLCVCVCVGGGVLGHFHILCFLFCFTHTSDVCVCACVRACVRACVCGIPECVCGGIEEL